jgi:hypothetical protein
VPETDSSLEQRAAFFDAIKATLRPLMQLALSYGIGCPDLLHVVRGVYVEAIRNRLVEQGRPVTIPRVAIAAGVTRGEVEKLFGLAHEEESARANRITRVDQIAVLLVTWHGDIRFSTPYGAPLDLSLEPERGFRTIDELIAVACPGTSRDEVIDELVTAGCIEIHENKFLRCVSRSYIPTGVDVSQVALVGRALSALSTTLAHNILRSPNEPAYFHRSATSDFPMPVQARDALLEWLRNDGQRFIDSADRWIAEMAPENLTGEGKRYGVAAFFYEDTGSAPASSFQTSDERPALNG